LVRDRDEVLARTGAMTAAQLILISVTSAIVAVFAMLVVATILRGRMGEEPEPAEPESDGTAGPKEAEPDKGGPDKAEPDKAEPDNREATEP
jgi:hypothetical protein